MNDMLDARDKWLKPNDGLMLPDRLTFHLGAMTFTNPLVDYWNNVYDFNMACMGEFAASEPYVDVVKPHERIGEPAVLIDMNLYTVPKTIFNGFGVGFKLDCMEDSTIGAFYTFFKAHFTNVLKPVEYSSEDDSLRANWRPFVFPLRRHTTLPVSQGDKVYGMFRMAQKETGGVDWQIEFCLNAEDENSRQTLKFVSSWY